MRYELYECLRKSVDHTEDCYIFIKEMDDLNALIDFKVECPPSRLGYVYIDNETPYPINYYLLGMDQMPTLEEHYAIILKCKTAKQISKLGNIDTDADDCYDKFDIAVLNAERETRMYFDRLEELKMRSKEWFFILH